MRGGSRPAPLPHVSRQDVETLPTRNALPLEGHHRRHAHKCSKATTGGTSLRRACCPEGRRPFESFRSLFSPPAPVRARRRKKKRKARSRRLQVGGALWGEVPFEETSRRRWPSKGGARVAGCGLWPVVRCGLGASLRPIRAVFYSFTSMTWSNPRRTTGTPAGHHPFHPSPANRISSPG